MMTRRFRLVAVYLGAFTLGVATTAAQTPTRAARATPIAVSTAVPLSADQMRETVGAGWWQTVVILVGGVVETVASIFVGDGGESCALNPPSCG